MFYQAKIATALVLVCSLSVAASTKDPVPLSIDRLEKLKTTHCAFFHVWATWCQICIQEMPQVLANLSTRRRLSPVVIDVSAKMVQDNFSIGYMRNLRPAFPVYLKPQGQDDAYLQAIDPKWSGALPYFALFDRGKLLRSWVGEQNLDALFKEAEAACPK